MCGIAGYYNAPINTADFESVRQNLRHRGPDGNGQFVIEHVALIHTRLSIIDLSELGAQPYVFENLVLVFNGELYNYKEIRVELKKAGYSFQSQSDSEVLIKAFHRWGTDCVRRFIGMFAFAIYDKRKDELFLFRDRLGVKPLYYAKKNHQLVFASELKALPGRKAYTAINELAAYFYFRFGYVPAPHAIFEGVQKLEPGHFLHITKTSIEKIKYWELPTSVITTKSEIEWVDELDDLLKSSFRYRMVSDVPVGVFLSGGIDSSLLTAILRKECGGIHTFTIGFDEKEFDESLSAREVANYLKTNHTEKVLPRTEASLLFESFYTIYDEPFADTSGIPLSYIAQLTKSSGVKVVLSADGGDELFGGYTHYLKANKLFSLISSIPRTLRKTSNVVSKKVLSDRLRRKFPLFNVEHRLHAIEELYENDSNIKFYESFLSNQTNHEIDKLMPGGAQATLGSFASHASLLSDMLTWDLKYYLPDDLLVKVDRATMLHGVECREPFLDHRLVEFASQMPLELKIKDGNQKYLLKKVLSRYLPPSLFEREKKGFSIPLFQWFDQSLDKMFRDHLDPERLKHIPLINAKEVQHELSKYQGNKKRGKDYNIEKMWRILSFVLWWEKYGN